MNTDTSMLLLLQDSWSSEVWPEVWPEVWSLDGLGLAGVAVEEEPGRGLVRGGGWRANFAEKLGGELERGSDIGRDLGRMLPFAVQLVADEKL